MVGSSASEGVVQCPEGRDKDLRPPSLPNSTECRHRRRTASRRRGAAAPPSGDTSANSENRRSDLAVRLATSCPSSVSVIFVHLSSACKCAKSGLIRPRIARGRRSRTPRIYVIASIHESGFVRFSPICLTMLRRCASCSSRQRFASSFLQTSGHPENLCRAANTYPFRVCRGLSPPRKCARPGAQKKASNSFESEATSLLNTSYFSS